MAKRFNQSATKYTDHDKDVALFLSTIEDYFDNTKTVYSVSGLCLHLGLSKNSFANYAKRPAYADIIDYARLRIENQVEEGAMLGRYQHQVAIFTLKNNFGWTDKQEIDQKVTSDNTNTNYNFDNLTVNELKELLKGE